MRLGLFAALIIGSLLFLGYSRNQDDTLSFTTPKGWAAPIPMEKGSWKERLAGIEKNTQEEPLFVLEMAQEPTGQAQLEKNLSPSKSQGTLAKKLTKLKHKKSKKMALKSKSRHLKRTALR